MNADSNAASGVLSPSAARSAKRWTARRLYWSIRRELWENRSIYLVPLAVAVVVLVGFTIGLLRLPQTVRDALALDPTAQRAVLGQPYDFSAYLFMGTTFVVAIFYCLDALQGERRDRSILFWKSLPVSDFTAVMAKASVPMVILPFLSIALTVLVNLIMLVLSSLVLVATGNGVALLWANVPIAGISATLLYHMIAVHALGYAPIYAWLLLVSAWSRRAAFLWALLPPLAIVLIERLAFNSSHFASLLMSRMAGGAAADMTSAPGDVIGPVLAHTSLWEFVASPALWLGLLVAGAFLAIAVRVRQDASPY
jgi:ABC-2 type transport system permease protein